MSDEKKSKREEALERAEEFCVNGLLTMQGGATEPKFIKQNLECLQLIDMLRERENEQ